jgi:predicted membrane-bound mannosyltransferase
MLLVVAIAILGIHSGIAQREYHFIYPAIVPLAVLVGVGLAPIASWGRQWLIGRSMPLTAAAADAFDTLPFLNSLRPRSALRLRTASARSASHSAPASAERSL